jgi:TolA-binding protein
MNKIRKLILYYSSDQINKKNKFIINYKLYKKELDIRNVSFIKKRNNDRKQLFNISLYGYDDKLKYISNKINCIPAIIKKIDSMPFGKIEKNEGKIEKNKNEKIKSIELYTNAHPKSTVHGTGYKNKETAEKTLLLIQKKTKKYQFLIINVLYQRAKYHKHQTKGMKDAMKVFRKWLDNYQKEKKIENRKSKKRKRKK